MSQLPASSARAGNHLKPANRWFALLLGIFLGVALLKFGTPTVMDHFLDTPGTGVEWLVFVWPLRVAYVLIGLVAVVGLASLHRPGFKPRGLLFLPLAWFGWQCVAATQSVETNLSAGVLAHFLICLGCFYLGLLGLQRAGATGFFWLPLLIAFGIMLGIGWEQHFGGLQQTRDYFWTYLYPKLPNVPPEYLKKMQSNRIFGTVFYPNAFAGALLLLTPPLLAWVWQAKTRFTTSARALLCGLIGGGSAACLYWTGSKGGWLLALLAGWIALLQQHFSKQLKLWLIVILLVAGGAGFYLKNREYMQRGATSVVARFDYWRAAWQTAVSKPFFGTGPGTFALAYQAIKKPESEMARLTHNDYLQQASDSGFPGLLTYVAFIGGMIGISYRRLDWQKAPLAGGVWLGLFTWVTQSAFEFTLYVPSLAWIAFTLMGWLLYTTGETIRQNPPPAPNLSAR